MLGRREVSTAPRIHQGRYWNIEHVPDTSIPGWIVIVLRRHASALHELTPEEFVELASLLDRSCRALHDAFACQKEYIMQFSESEHFQHVHFHVVPRAGDLADTLKGPRIFGALGVDDGGQLSNEEMTAAANRIRACLERQPPTPEE